MVIHNVPEVNTIYFTFSFLIKRPREKLIKKKYLDDNYLFFNLMSQILTSRIFKWCPVFKHSKHRPGTCQWPGTCPCQQPSPLPLPFRCVVDRYVDDSYQIWLPFEMESEPQKINKTECTA